MRRAVLSTLVVSMLALAVWSCREQLVAPGKGTMPGTARTLRITPSRLDLTVGGSATVTATLLDGTGSVVALPDGFALTFTSIHQGWMWKGPSWSIRRGTMSRSVPAVSVP